MSKWFSYKLRLCTGHERDISCREYSWNLFCQIMDFFVCKYVCTCKIPTWITSMCDRFGLFVVVVVCLICVNFALIIIKSNGMIFAIFSQFKYSSIQVIPIKVFKLLSLHPYFHHRSISSVAMIIGVGHIAI